MMNIEQQKSAQHSVRASRADYPELSGAADENAVIQHGIGPRRVGRSAKSTPVIRTEQQKAIW